MYDIRVQKYRALGILILHAVDLMDISFSTDAKCGASPQNGEV